MVLRYTATPDAADVAPAGATDVAYPWAALAPAGTPVVRVDRDAPTPRAVGGPVVLLGAGRGARDRLRSAAAAQGLRVRSEFVVLPSLGSPFLVAEDDAGPVTWLRGDVLTVPAGTTFLAPAVAGALRLLRALPWRVLSRIAPGRALVAVPPGSAGTAGGLESVAAAPGTRRAVLAMSRDVNAKVSVMLFPPGSAHPGTVVKAATTQVAAGAVRAEGAVLEALREKDLPILRETMPALLGTFSTAGLPALVTGAVPGLSQRTTYHRWLHTARRSAVGRDFAVAAQWLARLQSESAGEPAALSRLGEGLDRIALRWPGHPDAVRVEERLRPVARRLAATTAPTTVVHGDFWHGNVLARGNRVTGVVDWEYGQQQGDPTRDVACYPLGYALYLDRHTPAGWAVPGHRGLRAGAWGAGAEHAVLRRGWFGELTYEFVERALARLGLPVSLAAPVLLAGMVQSAVDADRDDYATLHLALLRRVVDRLDTLDAVHDVDSVDALDTGGVA